MTTMQRLRQWVDWWSSEGKLDDKGPRRPRDVGEYHDKLLRRAASTIASVERERGE